MGTSQPLLLTPHSEFAHCVAALLKCAGRYRLIELAWNSFKEALSNAECQNIMFSSNLRNPIERILPYDPLRSEKETGMDWGWLAGMTGFAFAMAATPGPNNTIVAASGAMHGLARTMPVMLGIAFGVASIMLAVTTFGISAITDPYVIAALKWAGVAYLLWLAWKIGSAAPLPNDLEKEHQGAAAPLSFIQGAFFQFINPKLWIMVGSAVVTYGTMKEMGPVQLAAIFALVFGGMTFVSVVAWAALGISVRRFLTSRRAVRTFNVVMAILLLISLIPIVFE
ncbi:LysE family translocator [Agrobacterium vitis]|nr:LysE family translocator [Agrobacterium vitis]